MNRINIAVVVVIAIALLAIANAQTGPQGQVGRYQLFSGDHLVGTSKGAFTQKDIMRLDTQTGDTYVWVDSTDSSGRLTSAWAVIPTAGK